MEDFEVIILVETFVEEKNYQKIENALPNAYNWTWMKAERSKIRGRASGGMIYGIKQVHSSKDHWQDATNWTAGATVMIGGAKIDIMGVYNRTGVAQLKTNLSKRLEASKGRSCLLMGDWNARAGTLSGIEEEDGGKRESMDNALDKEGIEMIELMEEFGFGILNGRTAGDWQGQITHVDYRSTSVIDYAACNNQMSQYITEIKIGNNTNSDHFPIEITLGIGSHRLHKETSVKWVTNYSPDAMINYKRAMERKELTTETSWSELSRHMREALPKRIAKSRENADKDWWTKECYVRR